ncbi:MAG: hypothetical protein NTZ80_02285 [Patescibacteria group bacterium]|nr:hypothetical protein [Patescibacteria group bacterium]
MPTKKNTSKISSAKIDKPKKRVAKPQANKESDTEIAVIVKKPITKVEEETLFHKKPSSETKPFQSDEISSKEPEPKAEDQNKQNPIQKFQMRISHSGKKALAIFIALAVCLILLISFITLPTATIYIEPRTTEEIFATSITFADRTINQYDLLTEKPNYIATETLSYTLELTSEYPATGELFEGKPARGEITIYNRGTKPKTFVPSRFKTQDDLLFWIESEVKVPERLDDATPGSITVPAHAADYDTFGRPIGTRGNIQAGQQLTMPAIPYLSPLLYYGVNHKAFTGGTAISSKIVLQEDLDLARKRIEEELTKKTMKLMDEKIIARNKAENRNDTMLMVDGSYDYKVEEVKVDKNLLGQKRATFPATIKLTVTGRVYNRDDLYRILVSGLQSRITPGMHLGKVDFSGMEMNIAERNIKKELIRINTEIRGLTIYDFDPENETGQEMTKRIRQKLAGQQVTWAEKYLQNLTEVENADIVTWPFWRDKLPSVENNIEIKVKN